MAVYVKIDDCDEEILPGQPGVVAIVPTSAKFQAIIKKEQFSVQRQQIPLAPAQKLVQNTTALMWMRKRLRARLAFQFSGKL